MKKTVLLTLGLLFVGMLSVAQWKPVPVAVMSEWGELVTPENVHSEYPRPNMTRNEWQNLNGLWEFQEAKLGENAPFGKKLKESILVPFAWESSLSGLGRQIESQRAWYKRSFSINGKWKGQRILIHFEAVDWETVVYVNGKYVGSHQGGYDSFSFDITDFLLAKGKQELVVSAFDPVRNRLIAKGKQEYARFNDPEGAFYTATSGIWQTVWLEPVPEKFIYDVKITPDTDKKQFRIKVVPGAKIDAQVEVIVKNGETEVAKAKGRLMKDLYLEIDNPRLWSPDDPFLYDVDVRLFDNGQIIDVVSCYAGMRSVSIKVINDIPRICLNGKPIYQHGPLDQGYWPESQLTPPSDEAIQWDIRNIKDWGFNMIRKHVKIESKRWYYWCDKLGVLVWQDMPCFTPWTQIDLTDDDKNGFEKELSKMVEQHYNHPSIIMWIVFNEHWGLYDVERLTEGMMKRDPSRLVMGNSGIDARNPNIDYEAGHIKDNHSYLPPSLPLISNKRVTVNGEYGALGYHIPEHSWSNNGKYFHDYYKDKADKKIAATDDYVKFMEQIHDYIKRGLSATVYTQWTDVENEVNGLYTYNRKLMKLDVNRVTEANRKCYQIELERKY